MHFSDAVTEYCFDCKVRKLSPKSISNYQKQLKYLQSYTSQMLRTIKYFAEL